MNIETLNNQNTKVIQLKIIDNELSDFRDESYHESYPNGLLRSYLLVNPNEDKLKELKQIVEHRRDFEDNFEELSDEEYQKLDEFADSIWDYIEDFIEKNFTVIKIDDTFDISY